MNCLRPHTHALLSRPLLSERSALHHRACALAVTLLLCISGTASALPQNSAPAEPVPAKRTVQAQAVPADSMDALIKQLNSTEGILADTAAPHVSAVQDRLLPFITEQLAKTAASAIPAVSASSPAQPDAAEQTGENQLFAPAERVFNTALEMLGTRYAWGGNSKQQGFDCSGLVRAVYRKALSVELPRSAHAQANSSKLMSIGRQELAAGDLVFFNTRGKTYSHVGVYLGDRQFMHAPRKGKNVRIDSMGKSYWSKRFTGARRAVTPVGNPAAGGMHSSAAGDRS